MSHRGDAELLPQQHHILRIDTMTMEIWTSRPGGLPMSPADDPVDVVETDLNVEVNSNFVAFRNYRLRAPQTMQNPLRDRASFLHDHGTALESMGFNLPGLAVLEAMLTTNSPVSGAELLDQVQLVDRGIEAAYLSTGRGGMARGYSARTRHEHDNRV
jgi:hypothetical protein